MNGKVVARLALPHEPSVPFVSGSCEGSFVVALEGDVVAMFSTANWTLCETVRTHGQVVSVRSFHRVFEPLERNADGAAVLNSWM